jgi:hypothetical protein
MLHSRFRWLALAAVLAAAIMAAPASAAGITVTNDTNVTNLVNALLGGGTGGITVTNATLDFRSSGTNQNTGTFTTSGPNNYKLTGSGIFLSSGNAHQDGTSGPVIPSVTTAYGVPATPAQFALLHQVSPSANSFFDVAELTITFTAGPNTSNVFFQGVFGSAEYPHFVGAFVDGFGLFLNGTNIAFADGMPVNINSTDMVNTNFAGDPTGKPGDQFQETAMQGLLVGGLGTANENPVLLFSGAVVPGSTGNTLIFIIADANDALLDTGIFLLGLGNAPPLEVPEPATLALFGLGAAGLAAWRIRRKRAA